MKNDERNDQRNNKDKYKNKTNDNITCTVLGQFRSRGGSN
jgi:hypothetical protein